MWRVENDKCDTPPPPRRTCNARAQRHTSQPARGAGGAQGQGRQHNQNKLQYRRAYDADDRLLRAQLTVSHNSSLKVDAAPSSLSNRSKATIRREGGPRSAGSGDSKRPSSQRSA